MAYCAGKLIGNLGCWENTRKAYHAGKLIESVVYCLNILKLRYVLKSIKVAQSRSGNLLGFCYLPPSLRSKRFLARFV